MRISFTGHRSGRLPADADVRLRSFLEGVRSPDLHLISGMADGFDQLVARTAVELGIPFTAAVPWVGHALHWDPERQEIYLGLLEKAAEVKIVSDLSEYKPWVYDVRDRWMVDNSVRLCSAWDGVKKGGTWNTIKYAQKVGRQISHLFHG